MAILGEETFGRLNGKAGFVAYAESAIHSLGPGRSSLSPEGRMATVRELLGRMAADVEMLNGTFMHYVKALQCRCPDGVMEFCRQILESGDLASSLPAEETSFMAFRRLAQVLRIYLQSKVGHGNPLRMLLVETAMDAWTEARILLHRAAPLSDNLIAPPREESEYRAHALAQQKLFLRITRDLRNSAEEPGEIDDG